MERRADVTISGQAVAAGTIRFNGGCAETALFGPGTPYLFFSDAYLTNQGGGG